MKTSWKKKYTRFLLQQAETLHFPRFAEFTHDSGPDTLEKLRVACFVTEDERRTITDDELGPPFGPPSQRVEIPPFPTPFKIIKRLPAGTQKELLKRLYFEYQFLCSFAHGDAEASLFRAISDTRSVARHIMAPENIEDFYQRQVLEPPIAYSALSSLQAATEIAAVYPNDIELMVKISQGWATLLKYHHLAAPMWEIRSKGLIPLLPPSL